MTEVEVPKFHELFVPALRALSGGTVMAAREVATAVADELALSPEQRGSRIPSGQRRFDNRVNWALSYLFQARAVAKRGRGQYEVTQRGRDLLSAHPHGFAPEVLEQFAEFREFRSRSKAQDGHATRASGGASTDSQTPLEQIDGAVTALHSEVALDLVRRIQAMPPEFLEKAVLRLLVAMGYGSTEDSALHMGGPGDGGFDGVINQDQLGIGRIYIQAKRYADHNVVGRPAVQGFLGALHHAGAVGGVFITTSRFTTDAIEFARSITPRVIMIDGERLGRLLVTHGVGVQERQVFRVVETDEDFFDES